MDLTDHISSMGELIAELPPIGLVERELYLEGGVIKMRIKAMGCIHTASLRCIKPDDMKFHNIAKTCFDLGQLVARLGKAGKLKTDDQPAEPERG